MDTRGNLMDCYVCKTKLIWGGDMPGTEIGLEDDDTIVTNLSCPNCGAYHEVTWNGATYELDS